MKIYECGHCKRRRVKWPAKSTVSVYWRLVLLRIVGAPCVVDTCSRCKTRPNQPTIVEHRTVVEHRMSLCCHCNAGGKTCEVPPPEYLELSAEPPSGSRGEGA